MKKIKFNIRTEKGLVEKTGYEVIYNEPFSAYRFAVRKVYNSINSDTRWVVTELSTGLAIGGNIRQHGQTRTNAIREGREILGIVGFDEFKQHVKNNTTHLSAVIL